MHKKNKNEHILATAKETELVRNKTSTTAFFPNHQHISQPIVLFLIYEFVELNIPEHTTVSNIPSEP
jgi:hypothetical protein